MLLPRFKRRTALRSCLHALLFTRPTMSLILYVLLAVLAVVTLVFLIPFLSPIRSAVLPLTSTLTIPSYLLLALSVALLLTSYIDFTKYRALSSSTTASSADYHAHFSRQVEAERDCILASTCMVLVLVCGRLAQMWRENALWQKKYVAMEKQARGASAAYMSNIANTPTSAPNTSTAPSSTHAAELSELKAERDKWRHQLTAMEKQLQAMEKQARSANEAFLASDGRGKDDALQRAERLKAEVKALKEDNEQLRTRVEDFELVMGDTRKKKM